LTIGFFNFLKGLGFNFVQIGHTSKVLLSWILQGRLYEVTDMSKKGQPCEPGYDSHFVRVKNKRLTNGITDFYPVKQGEQHTADEVVVFESNQILPWFLVHFQRIA
jgi:hypothetical protein